jgi:DNA/RNA-binding domain of Phe-tRNA-synthetase-like protein
MEIFRYDNEILQSFPKLRAAVVHVRDLKTHFDGSDFNSRYAAEQQNVRETLGEKALSELSSIEAWRRVFRGFGVKPTKYRSAVEALLRRLQKHGQIPSIHPLVDLANWVSIRFCLPVAAFDLRCVQTPLTVCFSKGEEWFTALHQDEAVHPDPGEVIFLDTEEVVHARRWCWRQSKQSASTPETTDALFTLEGHHPTAHEDVFQGMNLLLDLLRQYATGSFDHGLLDPDHPLFPSDSSSQNPGGG